MSDYIYNLLFGARVKIYRERLGLTQKELAENLGYSSSAVISRIEKGAQTIPLSKISDFCNVLKCEPYDLLGLRENDKQVWGLAEKLEKTNRQADLQKFIDLYLRMMEGGN